MQGLGGWIHVHVLPRMAGHLCLDAGPRPQACLLWQISGEIAEDPASSQPKTTQAAVNWLCGSHLMSSCNHLPLLFIQPASLDDQQHLPGEQRLLKPGEDSSMHISDASSCPICMQTMQCIGLHHEEKKTKETTRGRVMQGILGEFPGYIDCYLRLACLQARRGDLEAAHEWAAKALAASNNHSDCLAVQGNTPGRKHQYKDITFDASQ